MATPLIERGHAPPRTLDGIEEQYLFYLVSGSVRKQAQHFYNCIFEPIFNIPLEQVCPPGLHITLGIFTKIFTLLEELCHQLDLELAFHNSDDGQSSFCIYSQELQKLQMYTAEILEAKQSQQNLEQAATYMVLALGESHLITMQFMQQSAERTKSVEQLELDKALQGFGVHRQQYFGGAFVGNHVHAALKVSNINKLLTSILCAARANLPHKAEMVENETVKFLNVFTLFAKCHAIYDNNFIDETNVEKLGQCIKEFLSYFRTAFPGATIPIKMHMLEDHATEWVRLTHVGFGLLGEQGAESIHAKFNSLGRAYTAIPDRVERLKCA
eukprot:Em0002g990a